MNGYIQILKRAKQFSAEDLAALMPVSRRTVYALFSGECRNPRFSTVMALEKAVTRLESVAAKTKPSKTPAKKQTAARDKHGAVVAGGSK